MLLVRSHQRTSAKLNTMWWTGRPLVSSEHVCKDDDCWVFKQSRRIIEKYEEILFRPAPEAIVEQTHHDIRALLCSEACLSFRSNKDKEDDGSVEAADQFIKKTIEAVGPILPIAMRNKSLD